MTMNRGGFLATMAAAALSPGCGRGGSGTQVGDSLAPGASSFLTMAASQDPALLDRGGAVYNVRHPSFGAAGDGSDETVALQAALDAAAAAGGGVVLVPAGRYRFTGRLRMGAGVRLQGVGTGSVLVPDNKTGDTITIAGNGTAVLDLVLEGRTPGGIRVIDGAKDVLVRGVTFRGLGQCVWLWTCSQVTVDGCTFERTGYGVIQQAGHASDFVRVTGCLVRDARSDFIEANCTGNAVSRAWIIDGNRYLGHAAYGSPSFAGGGPEDRFIGITAVEGVTIVNNHCTRSGGDSAIHLEDVAGEIVIAGNVLKDCQTTHENNGYVYLMHSDKNAVIAHNIFIHEDVDVLGTAAVGISTRSGRYTMEMIIEGNRFVGPAGGGAFGGLDLRFNQGATVVSGNQFVDLARPIVANETSGVQVQGNAFVRCGGGILADPGQRGGTCNDWLVTGNAFQGTTGPCILVRRNRSGTGASRRWLVSNNRFDADVLGFDTEDMVAIGNVLAGAARFDLGATQHTGSEGYRAESNVRWAPR